MKQLAKCIQKAAHAYKQAAQHIQLTSVRQKLKRIGHKKEKHYSAFYSGSKAVIPPPDAGAVEPHLAQRKYKNSTEKWLVSCLLHEEEVMKAYQRVLISGELEKEHIQLCLSLLQDSLTTYNQLKSIKESMHYQSAGSSQGTTGSSLAMA